VQFVGLFELAGFNCAISDLSLIDWYWLHCIITTADGCKPVPGISIIHRVLLKLGYDSLSIDFLLQWWAFGSNWPSQWLYNPESTQLITAEKVNTMFMTQCCAMLMLSVHTYIMLRYHGHIHWATSINTQIMSLRFLPLSSHWYRAGKTLPNC